MANISDIKVGVPGRGMTRHKMKFNAHTTLGFGQVVPASPFIEMLGDSKISGVSGSVVRMDAMPAPTFGDIEFKNYARFIPITDVFRNYPNLKTARSITTQFGQFIPTSVPYFLTANLSKLILSNYCCYCIYQNGFGGATSDYSAGSNDNKGAYVNFKGVRSVTYGSSAFSSLRTNFIDKYGVQLGTTPSKYSVNLNFDNADFIQMLPYSDITSGTAGKDAFFVFRLSKDGQLLYKILTSLGWKFDLSSTRKISILPFLAWYKGWFELFAPANLQSSANNYTDTNAFRLSDYCCEHDVKNVQADSSASSLFLSFLEDLTGCYYYRNPDFITSMVSSPSISPATTPGLSSPTSLVMDRSNVVSGSLSNSQPTLRSDTGINLTIGTTSAWNVKLLLRLLPYINKDTVLGGRVRQLLKSRFNIDADTLEGETYSCGKHSLSIDINTVVSQSDTGNTGALLGEYGGFGVGASNDKDYFSFKYKSKKKEPGYLMTYCCIVPSAGFFQGVNPALSHGTDGRFSFYDPAFDSLGFSLFMKDVFMGQKLVNSAPVTYGTVDVFPSQDLSQVAFGFNPRDLERKVSIGDSVNGDYLRLMYRDRLGSMILAREVADNNVLSFLTEKESESDPDTYDLTVLDRTQIIPTATPQLRSVGLLTWLEHYNKIFYQDVDFADLDGSYFNVSEFDRTFGAKDPFYVSTRFNIDYFSHMKPVSESFETLGDGETPGMDVSHA